MKVSSLFFHSSRVLIVGIILSLCALSILTSENVAADCEGQQDEYGYSLCAEPIVFEDVINHLFKEAVEYAQRNRIVKGYDDGNFRPDNPINRAEFTKVLVEAILGKTPGAPDEPCFPDVEKGIWFEVYVCYGKGKLFDGYPDGTFGPSNNINFAEASKILSNTFELIVGDSVEGEEWYGPFIVALNDNKAIPGTIKASFHLVTRGEMVEMIMRLKEKLKDKASLEACDFVPQRCPEGSFKGYGDEFLPKTVDMQKVRLTWLAWYNNERQNAGLHDYKYNNELNRTAYIWSDFSKDRGELSHKRIGQTEYYDYNMITEWFGSLGLQFENINRVTHSENIGSGGFSCSEADCTDEMIDSIRSTFDFYMSEKDQDYRPHYNSVMNKYFNEIGLGIVIDESQNKYYLTVHYGTRLT